MRVSSTYVAAMLAVLFVFAMGVDRPAAAQGAALSGIANTAENLNQTVQDNARALTTGPADRMEKTKPGKIDRDAQQKFTKTNSGLKYRVLRKSRKTKPKASSDVKVHYKGWLDNKSIFDSSYRRGKPAPLNLSRVIKGWTEGMQLIGEGGMIELDIPYQLGYGVKGSRSGKIPPNARLHFIVELISVD